MRAPTSNLKDAADDVLDIEQYILLNNYEKAWELFHEKAAVGDVHVRDCNIVLKMCENSEQVRHHINVTMPAAGVRPDVVTFTHLIRQLVVEGQKDAARTVYKRDMPAARVIPNRRTRATLAMSEYDVKRIRRARAWANEKTRGPVQDFEKMLLDKQHNRAWRQFRDKLKRGQVNLIECNMMVKGCLDSAQMRRFIKRDIMRKAGIQPDIITYSTLIRELILEDDIEAARKVVKEDFRRARLNQTG